MRAKPRHLPLPSGRAGVATPTEWLRVALAGSLLLGPRYIALVAAARSGNRRLLHTLERSWARAAAKAVDLHVEVDGASRIDPDERYVVAPLHESLADAIALQSLPLDMTFAARDELFTWRFLGGYLRAAAHPLVPTRSDRSAYRALLDGARRTFAAGESLVVFPQGSILGVETAFQPGAFRIAARFDRPLLPVVLAGGHRVWEHPYSPRLRSGATIRLEVLDPVPASAAVATMRDTERAMKRRALQLEPGPRRFDPDRDGWWDGYAYEIDDDFVELRNRVAAHRRHIRTTELVSVRSG